MRKAKLATDAITHYLIKDIIHDGVDNDFIGMYNAHPMGFYNCWAGVQKFEKNIDFTVNIDTFYKSTQKVC